MPHPSEEPRSVYYQAFTRDDHKCVFCDRELLESFDSRSASHLNHLKPIKAGGSSDDVLNRVTACGVCANVKGSFDPSPDGPVTTETFDQAVATTRSYVLGKRQDNEPYHRDFNYWLMESARASGSHSKTFHAVERTPDMLDQFPKDIEQSIEQGAARLGRALQVLEWPNGGKDAPCHEVNALINISFYLGNLPKPYEVYAEGTVAQRGRVDMIGFNGETAIALEAKAFGAINRKSDEAVKDLKRLETFRPSLSELAGNQIATQWWDEAKSRWGIIVISSFRGRGVRDAWMARDENEFGEKMSTYSGAERPQVQDDGTASGFLALYRAVPALYRRAAEITDAVRWGPEAGGGWLLWGAIPLPRGGG